MKTLPVSDIAQDVPGTKYATADSPVWADMAREAKGQVMDRLKSMIADDIDRLCGHHSADKCLVMMSYLYEYKILMVRGLRAKCLDWLLYKTCVEFVRYYL